MMDHEYTSLIEEKPTVTESIPSRTRWFTNYEKQELYKILDNYKGVFNNSSGEQCNSRKSKQEAWEEITEELNKRCGMARTPNQVSLYYKNLKQRAKQRLEKTIRKEINPIEVLSTNKSDIIYVSSEPELITIEPISAAVLTEQQEIEIRKKKLELLDIELIHKRKLMKLEIEYAEKRKQLIDLEINLKKKQLENSYKDKL